MTSLAAHRTTHPMRRLTLALVAGAAVFTLAPTAAAEAAPAPAVVQPAVNAAVAAMNVALDQQGKPYAYGATGPGAFDCSGLVQYAFGHVGIEFPRTTGAQAGMGVAVGADQLQAGDLVFAYGGGHVGIYVGEGNYVYAPTDGDVVKVGPVPFGEITALRHL